MEYYPKAVGRLIEALQQLPGIGPKTAQRLTFYLLSRPGAETQALADALSALRTESSAVRVCFNVADVDPCRLCQNPSRDSRLLLRRRRTQRPLGYRADRGVPRPLPRARRRALPPGGDWSRRPSREGAARAAPGGGVEEIILATNPNVEGDATALYLARLLRPLGVRITRIARGLPTGGISSTPIR